MLDFTADDGCGTARRNRGAVAHHAGLAAEDGVARAYRDRGMALAASRWRGAGGELDLILQDGDALVFVEVKKARTFDAAMARVTHRQVARLFAAAQEFCATQPRGALTDMRFDVALVDAHGMVRIVEDAFL